MNRHVAARRPVTQVLAQIQRHRRSHVRVIDIARKCQSYATALLLCLGTTFLQAQVLAPENSKYRLYDSRSLAQTHGGSVPQLFWISNEDVLFVAKRRESAGPAGERLAYTVSRWNIEAGTISSIQEFGENVPTVCFHDGYLLLQVRRKDESLEAYHGKVGERLQRVDPRAYGMFFCRRLDETEKIPKWMQGREARRLGKINAGFLDFGDSKGIFENTPIRLYRYGEKQVGGIELPFRRRDTGKRFPFYEFKRAFFVVSDYSVQPRPKEVPYPVYWLYGDGRIEMITEIPWGPWRSRAGFFPYPTKAGLVLSSSNARTETDLGHAGLYLFSNGKVEKLLGGWIQGLTVAVSPDGCLIAFIFSSYVTRKDTVLQAMKLCQGG